MVSSMVVPSPGAEKTFRRPPTSSARSRMPETPRRPLRPPGLEAAAVVAHAQDGAADGGELDADGARARVLDDVGEALLRDAVEHQLLLVGQVRRLAVAVEGRADAGALAEVGDLAGEGGDEAVVVERGRAQRAGERQQLLHRLGGERLDLLELRTQPGRDVVSGGLESQQDRGQRLVDLVMEVLGDAGALLLLRADDGAAALHALLLEAGEHAVEVAREALDLARGGVVGLGALAGGGEVDALHRLHQALQRREPALEQQRVDQHGADDREADQQQPLQRGDAPASVGREQRGDDRRRGDEGGVDRQDLGEEGSGTHRLLDPPSAERLRSVPHPPLHFVKY